MRNSVLGRSVFVHSWSLVEDSVLMDYSEIGRHARTAPGVAELPNDYPVAFDLVVAVNADRR